MDAGAQIQGEHLHIDVLRDGEMVVVALRGELDLASAPRLQNTVEGSDTDDARLVVLDMENLEFIDSTGLRIVLAAHTRARERGQELALTRIGPQVQRLLTITRVGEHLRIVDSPEDLLV
jgi:anti-sigma B factor antagonist